MRFPAIKVGFSVRRSGFARGPPGSPGRHADSHHSEADNRRSERYRNKKRSGGEDQEVGEPETERDGERERESRGAATDWATRRRGTAASCGSRQSLIRADPKKKVPRKKVGPRRRKATLCVCVCVTSPKGPVKRKEQEMPPAAVTVVVVVVVVVAVVVDEVAIVAVGFSLAPEKSSETR